MQFSYPLVKRLAIHLEDEQTICYKDDEQTELANLLERAANERTMLTAWFEYNAGHQQGSHMQLLYHEFPTQFTWQVERKQWQPRKRTSDSIGRMYMTSPSMFSLMHTQLFLPRVALHD